MNSDLPLDETWRPFSSGATTQAQLVMDVTLLLVFALALRLLAYNGLFGSDDVTYFVRALDVATGAWSSADYNGALRYGFNIPAGGFVWLFGATPFVVNLWPLLCSLIEVGAVYWLGASMFNRKAGVFAALLLATAPLHIAVATRVHADPVVSMFVTLSFVLLWAGWAMHNKALLFACGLSIGGIFWAKELVGVVWLAFLPMLWLFRGRWCDALVVVAGTLLTLVLHGLLMTYIAGHPLHLIQTVLGQVKTNFIGAMQGEDAAAYYLRYLFIDLRHVGLVAILAVLGAWWIPRMFPRQGLEPSAWAYVLAWAVGLLLVLSVFPVSLSPLRLVMKQSNYITLFLGALAVLGGVALASMPGRLANGLMVAAAALGIWLAFLQQADYRNFTSGSKAIGTWVANRPGVVVFGSTNSASMGNFQAQLVNPDGPRGRIFSYRALADRPEEVADAVSEAQGVYAAFDAQTVTWSARGRAVTEPQSCWGQSVEQLDPVDLVFGNQVASASATVAASLERLGIPGMASAAKAFAGLARPAPVAVYSVRGRDPLCLQ